MSRLLKGILALISEEMAIFSGLGNWLTVVQRLAPDGGTIQGLITYFAVNKMATIFTGAVEQ